MFAFLYLKFFSKPAQIFQNLPTFPLKFPIIFQKFKKFFEALHLFPIANSSNFLQPHFLFLHDSLLPLTYSGINENEKILVPNDNISQVPNSPWRRKILHFSIFLAAGGIKLPLFPLTNATAICAKDYVFGYDREAK